MTDRTQQAASRCADLANAELDDRPYIPRMFSHDNHPGAISTIFRRYVERIDARDREVLALLDITQGYKEVDEMRVRAAWRTLRADLLPDPQPTPIEQLAQDLSCFNLGVAPTVWLEAMLNERGLVIAKREVKS